MNIYKFVLVTFPMLSLLLITPLQGDLHGHIIHRDREGHCTVEESNDDACIDGNPEDESHCHRKRYKQKKIEPGFEEEDLTYQVEQDTSWPSRRENFSEMFR